MKWSSKLSINIKTPYCDGILIPSWQQRDDILNSCQMNSIKIHHVAVNCSNNKYQQIREQDASSCEILSSYESKFYYSRIDNILMVLFI